MAFVYYSGHGLIVNGDKHQNTHIQHNNGTELTDIQSLASKLAMSPNVFVFLILDCCRVFQENKGPKYEGKPVGGQIYIAFGARVGVAATA